MKLYISLILLLLLNFSFCSYYYDYQHGLFGYSPNNNGIIIGIQHNQIQGIYTSNLKGYNAIGIMGMSDYWGLGFNVNLSSPNINGLITLQYPIDEALNIFTTFEISTNQSKSSNNSIYFGINLKYNIEKKSDITYTAHQIFINSIEKDIFIHLFEEYLNLNLYTIELFNNDTQTYKILVYNIPRDWGEPVNISYYFRIKTIKDGILLNIEIPNPPNHPFLDFVGRTLQEAGKMHVEAMEAVGEADPNGVYGGVGQMAKNRREQEKIAREQEEKTIDTAIKTNKKISDKSVNNLLQIIKNKGYTYLIL